MLNLNLTHRTFWTITLCWLTFRLWFAAVLPITGDESYFVLWGRFPDWGYYDHPPMVGWWMAGLLAISDHLLWLRLPSVLLPLGLALAAMRGLRFLGQDRALLAAFLVLLAPPNVWNVLITTDTPLILFGVLSALVFIHAHREQRLGLYAGCGLLFAAAVLSKYFAALLGIAFAVATLLSPTKKRIAGLFMVGFLMFPALALMLWWNAENCWPNILFNLVSRHARAGFQWQNPLTYVLMMVYMLGVLPLWYGLKTRFQFSQSDDRLFWALAWVPLLLFALLSLSKQIGLHWLLTFVPLALIGLARKMPIRAGIHSVRCLVVLAFAHVLVFVTLANLPLERWKNFQQFPSVVWTVKTQELVHAAGLLGSDRRWFTDGYTYSAGLSYALDRVQGRSSVYGGTHIGVFGPGSHYARQDDRLTNFAALDGQNFAILLRLKPDLKAYEPYFAKVTLDRFDLSGATFYRVLGDGFQYAAYRQGVLERVRERFYQFPAWLPDHGCFFGPRYFSGE